MLALSLLLTAIALTSATDGGETCNSLEPLDAQRSVGMALMSLKSRVARIQLQERCSPVPAGYEFTPHKDSPGNDIGHFGSDIQTAASQCTQHPDCKGFNSNGWAKSALVDESQWEVWTTDPCRGFYKRLPESSTTSGAPTTSACAVSHPGGYAFHPFKDSRGSDLGHWGSDVAAVAAQCDAHPGCAGFNSNGWAKGSIQDPSTWETWTSDPCRGLYEKLATTTGTTTGPPPASSTSAATTASPTPAPTPAPTTPAPGCAVPAGFTLVAFKDSPGSDFVNYGADAAAAAAQCLQAPECVAFNSNGWGKCSLKEEGSWEVFTADPCRGLFVKDSATTTPPPPTPAPMACSLRPLNSACPNTELPGYIFKPFKDSPGHALAKYDDDVATAAWQCSQDAACKGFNTNGWAKSALVDEASWDTWTADPCKGLYVKDAGAGSGSSGGTVGIGEVIVRVDTLMYGASGDSDVIAYIDDFVRMCKATGVKGVSLLMKRADVDVHKGLGHLSYRSALPHTATWSGDNYDEKWLFRLLGELRAAGVKTYAWLPVFNDYVLASSNSSLLQHARAVDGQGNFVSTSLSPSLKFVSPHSLTVRSHELALLTEILTHPQMSGWDGVRLDFIRYEEGNFDFSPDAVQSYRQIYGEDLMAVSSKSDKKYNDFRRSAITSFLQEAVDTAHAIDGSLDMGGYLLPFVADPCGYAALPNWGNDYTQYDEVGLRVMPMMYWQDWSSQSDYKAWLGQKMASSLAHTGDAPPVWPTYSITGTWWCGDEACHRQALADALMIASAGGASGSYGARDVSVFFYWKWGQTEWRRLYSSVFAVNQCLTGQGSA